MEKLITWLNASAELYFPNIGLEEIAVDPQLEALFVALGSASSEVEATPIESMIWSIWSKSGDKQVDKLMKRGNLALRQENLLDALTFFDAVVEILPDFAEGWNQRATVNYLLGDFDSSISDVERTLYLEPRHFGALSGLGMIALSLGQDEQALEAFEAALDIHPHLSGAMSHIKKLREKVRGIGS